MSATSIKSRLMMAAGLMIILALLAAGFSIFQIFERHVTKRVEAELNKHYTQLVSAIEVNEQGEVYLTKELADPRFSLPLSGLYWQVDLAGKDVARSRSLWEQKLVVPTPPTGATEEHEAHIHELPGPEGQMLYSIEGALWLQQFGVEKLFVVTVGIQKDEITSSVYNMAREVFPALAVLGSVLLLTTLLQIRLGLAPLNAIGKELNEIREGAVSRFSGAYPAEVQPLVDELNGLLNANEARTLAARQRAGDLAHGLRTPLAIMKSLARTVSISGLKKEGEKIELQTEHMRLQVERELAQALSTTEERASWLNARELIEKLVSVVSMVDDNRVTWAVDVSPLIEVKTYKHDFNEIMGNLLENAQKWAVSKARVAVSSNHLVVEDDGPGVEADKIASLTERGFSSGAGTGLGLSIVKQLAEKNGWQVTFGRSLLGGLEVRLIIPDSTLRKTSNQNSTVA